MLDRVIDIVKKGGNSLLLVADADRCVSSKEGKANFVTKYDLAMQEYLKEELSKLIPDAAFIGEEGDDHDSIGLGYAFIVDPIDGTTNFIRNYRKSCVSVGLAYQGEMVLGVVYNPYANEVFAAEKGKGAFLNNQPIHVSDCPLDESLVIMGTAPYYAELTDQTYDLAKCLQKECADIRRSGSAALDLCDVACGRADLFFELRLCPWDFAAGSLILTEAGGRISRTNGEELSLEEKCSVLAANSQAYEMYYKMDGHVMMP